MSIDEKDFLIMKGKFSKFRVFILMDTDLIYIPTPEFTIFFLTRKSIFWNARDCMQRTGKRRWNS